jgi:hypothetical protein
MNASNKFPLIFLGIFLFTHIDLFMLTYPPNNIIARQRSTKKEMEYTNDGLNDYELYLT